MKAKTHLISTVFLMSFVIFACTEKNPPSSPSWFYSPADESSNEPVLFAPGVISTGMSERDITFSPEGREVFYGLYFGRIVTIMTARLGKGRWSEPGVASFAADRRFFHLEPCLSSDGNRIFFLSTRPRVGEDTLSGWGNENIWAADRQADGSWGEAYDPGSSINTSAGEFYPSLTRKGSLVFTRSLDDGSNLIMLSRWEDNRFLPAEPLPDPVNKNKNLFNAFISPDEDFLIACAVDKSDSLNPGFANYYFFFKTDSGGWTPAINPGEPMNNKGFNAISASLSPDGQYLFFASQRTNPSITGMPDRPLKLKDLLHAYNSPQNGNYDIYRMNSAFINTLKQKARNP